MDIRDRLHHRRPSRSVQLVQSFISGPLLQVLPTPTTTNPSSTPQPTPRAPSPDPESQRSRLPTPIPSAENTILITTDIVVVTSEPVSDALEKTVQSALGGGNWTVVEQSFKGKSSRRVVTRDVMMCDFPASRTPIDVGECLAKKPLPMTFGYTLAQERAELTVRKIRDGKEKEEMRVRNEEQRKEWERAKVYWNGQKVELDCKMEGMGMGKKAERE